MDQKNQGLVEEYIEHYNSFEIDKMIDLFTNDCIFENVSNTSPPLRVIGKQELRNIASNARNIFKERKQAVTNWVCADDKIAVEIDYVAILAADLPNGMKEGDLLKLKGISFYEFENGKIKRLMDFS